MLAIQWGRSSQRPESSVRATASPYRFSLNGKTTARGNRTAAHRSARISDARGSALARGKETAWEAGTPPGAGSAAASAGTGMGWTMSAGTSPKKAHLEALEPAPDPRTSQTWSSLGYTLLRCRFTPCPTLGSARRHRAVTRRGPSPRRGPGGAVGLKLREIAGKVVASEDVT